MLRYDMAEEADEEAEAAAEVGDSPLADATLGALQLCSSSLLSCGLLGGGCGAMVTTASLLEMVTDMLDLCFCAGRGSCCCCCC